MIDSVFMGTADLIVTVSFASLLLPFAVERVRRRAELQADKAIHDKLSSRAEDATPRLRTNASLEHTAPSFPAASTCDVVVLQRTTATLFHSWSGTRY